MSKPRESGSGKPAGGRRTAKTAKKPGAASEQKRRLEGELVEAIQQINEEGLLFLLQQAQILLHNAQVDRINQEMLELQERRDKTTKRGKAASSADRSAPRSVAGSGAAVRIDEADNRKSFFLDFAGARKALSLPEMQRVVKICYTAESKSAALRQLYTLFSRERGDILADARIGGPSSPLLDALFYAVRDKYRLEER